jgi:hypothetical protein
MSFYNSNCYNNIPKSDFTSDSDSNNANTNSLFSNLSSGYSATMSMPYLHFDNDVCSDEIQCLPDETPYLEHGSSSSSFNLDSIMTSAVSGPMEPLFDTSSFHSGSLSPSSVDNVMMTFEENWSARLPTENGQCIK